MGRRSNTDTRRAQIVAGLMQVIASMGYEKASIQAIAQAAGLTPGLIHYHFKSKQAILLQLVQELAKRVQQRYERLCPPNASPQQRLQAFIDARLATGAGAQPEAVNAWVMVGVEAARQAEVREVYQQIIQDQITQLANLLGAALPDMPESDIKALATTLIATIEGLFQLSAAASEVMPKGFAAATVNNLVQRLCLPQK